MPAHMMCCMLPNECHQNEAIAIELPRSERKSEARFSSAIRVILSYLSFCVRLNQSSQRWWSVRERTITFFLGFAVEKNDGKKLKLAENTAKMEKAVKRKKRCSISLIDFNLIINH